MLSHLLLLATLFQAAHSLALPGPAAATAGVAPSDAATELVVRSAELDRAAALIFQDGFESGNTAWWEPPLFSATTTTPDVAIPCDGLPPGEYVFRVTADNDTGGMVYEYTLTVVETTCGVWPCTEFQFSDPVISFR